MSISSAKL